MNQDNFDPKQARDKECFTILHNNLIHFHEAFVSNSVKVSGFFLLIIGWISTSETAQQTLGRSELFRTLAVVILVLGAVMYTATCFRLWVLSNNVYGKLVELDYIPGHVFSDRLIRLVTLFLFVFSNLLLATTAALMTWFV